MSYELITFPDAKELAEHAAKSFVKHSKYAIAKRGRFAVALSGGSTPRAIFAVLSAEPFKSEVEWSKVHIFWGDERNVPPDHNDSNYRMAKETLLDHVAIPAENVHRMEGELDAAEAAAKYMAGIDAFFGDEPPHFDLIHLGMGDDGHTASLFPGTTALGATDATVVSNFVEKFNTNRITFTAPLINAARAVEFFVTGANKVDPLFEVLKGTRHPELYPSQLISPSTGTLTWLVDEAAATRLTA